MTSRITDEAMADIASWWDRYVRENGAPEVPDSLPGYRWNPVGASHLRDSYIADRAARGVHDFLHPHEFMRAFRVFGAGVD